MALFPKCEFKVLLPNGTVVAGERLEGALVLDVPEPIPRAERVELFFRSVAVAGYGSGENRSVCRREMFVAPLAITLPAGAPLASGTHRYPFAIDVPAWLPPRYLGQDCSIHHEIEARLDVDWAIDPKTSVVPHIQLARREGMARPLTIRSPNGFHESVVIEITLDSAVFSHDQPLTGQVALRSGHDARFDAITIALVSAATIRMARGDRRKGASSMLRVPAERLRRGESVPFSFLPTAEILPTFKNGFIDHDVLLSVALDIPWALDPSFEIALEMLPRGSTVYASGSVAGLVGAERIHGLAMAMAQATGLRAGRLPTLLEDRVGAVTVRIVDGPRDGKIGLDTELLFPDLELGLRFRPLGVLEGFRSSPLLPPGIDEGYLLRLSPERGRPTIPDDVIAELLRVLVGDLRSADEVQLDDHRVAFHLSVPHDGAQAMVAFAQFVHAKAQAIGDAIASLPFPAAFAAARPAWAATAAEQGATLTSTGPSLHGVTRSARVIGGEARTMRITIRTTWGETGQPGIAVDVDLRDVPLPKTAWAALGGEEIAALRGVRAAFPEIDGASVDAVTLASPSWANDPRSLFPPLEQFFGWVLDARGERRVDAPYR